MQDLYFKWHANAIDVMLAEMKSDAISCKLGDIVSIHVHSSASYFSCPVMFHNKHPTVHESRIQCISKDHYVNFIFELQVMRWFTGRTELVCHFKNHIFKNLVFLTTLSQAMRF